MADVDLHADSCQRRFLSPTEKSQLLEYWFRALTTGEWRPTQSPGEHGEPDADIVPWCMRLNRLPGVCTIQSCAGHRDGATFTNGCVWLRLDRELSQAFDHRACDLARGNTIESVARYYGGDGQLISAITFQGNERENLSTSMERICAFFEELDAERSEAERSA